jgi:uncharacterized Tic20 family protein
MSETQLVWGGETTEEERIWAVAAHCLNFVVPVLGALVIYFIQKDKSRFVAYHALQATAFQIAAWLLAGITCGIGLVVGLLAIWIAVKAYKGEWEGYPLLDGIGK